MLQKDVAARIMLDEIKTHPWVTMVCVLVWLWVWVWVWVWDSFWNWVWDY
jgi:hypothetical protein